jgi:Cdc6-like AAA superfamily ATPase
LSDDLQQDAESTLVDCTNKIGLQQNDILYASIAPESADKLCDVPSIETSLEWFTKSPEFKMWKEKGHCALLWLYGAPGDGKTVVMSYVRKRLPNHYGYAKRLDVASLFCSADHTENCLVASLVFQLIRNDLRAQAAKTKIKSWSGLPTTKNLWELLETLINGVSAFETVLLIDGIDALKPDSRSSFLTNFLALEKQVQSGAIIRVLISSRPFSDIQVALAHYDSIEREKERKG